MAQVGDAARNRRPGLGLGLDSPPPETFAQLSAPCRFPLSREWRDRGA